MRQGNENGQEALQPPRHGLLEQEWGGRGTGRVVAG